VPAINVFNEQNLEGTLNWTATVFSDSGPS